MRMLLLLMLMMTMKGQNDTGEENSADMHMVVVVTFCKMTGAAAFIFCGVSPTESSPPVPPPPPTAAASAHSRRTISQTERHRHSRTHLVNHKCCFFTCSFVSCFFSEAHLTMAYWSNSSSASSRKASMPWRFAELPEALEKIFRRLDFC